MPFFMFNRIVRYVVAVFFKPLSFGVVGYAATDKWKQHKTPGGFGGSEHAVSPEGTEVRG